MWFSFTLSLVHGSCIITYRSIPLVEDAVVGLYWYKSNPKSKKPTMDINSWDIYHRPPRFQI